MIAFHSKEMYIWNITKSMTGKVPMFGKFLASATVLLVLGLGAGCSFTNSSRQIVALTIDPADARVIANGVEYHNISPQFIEAKRSRELLLVVYKPGYREALYTVDYQLSDTGRIDAWGSIFILPFFGLFTEGAWELKENNIYIKLVPLPDEKAMSEEQQKTLEEKDRINAKFKENAVKTGMPRKLESAPEAEKQ